MTADWLRVSPKHPCPVCGAHKWCTVAPTGEAALCMKEPSDRPSKSGKGWIHTIGDALNGQVPSARVKTAGKVTNYAIERDGVVVAIHVRRDYLLDGKPAKEIWWERPGSGRGLNGTKVETLPLYGTDALAGLEQGQQVVVTEGEKAADALRSQGIAALGTVTGADTIPCDASLAVLTGYDVVLWPDNDVKGEVHMAAIAARLACVGVRARVLRWPAAPPKGDAADFLAAGLDVESLAIEEIVVASPPPATPGLVVHRLSDLQPEEVYWLWGKRVPLAKLTVLDGDPGLGKSTMTLDLAARVSRGDRMPDGTLSALEGPAGVLLLTAEDGVRDTVLPRLRALDADVSRVHQLESVPGDDGKPQMPAIPRDLGIIEHLIALYDVKLVILDPLIAFLGDSSETNTFRDQDVRRALGPFAQMLERAGAAAVLIRHLNKGNSANALYRGGGSIGIIGAARSALVVGKDPDDDTGLRRILSPTKSNLSSPPKAMAYHMEEAPNGSVRVAWEGETEHTAMGILADPLPAEERDAVTAAAEFLRAELYGGQVETKEMLRRARAADHSQRSIERARKRLGVLSQKGGWAGSPWFLSLPAKYLAKEPENG